VCHVPQRLYRDYALGWGARCYEVIKVLAMQLEKNMLLFFSRIKHIVICDDTDMSCRPKINKAGCLHGMNTNIIITYYSLQYMCNSRHIIFPRLELEEVQGKSVQNSDSGIMFVSAFLFCAFHLSS